jgi:hypothetical protein
LIITLAFEKNAYFLQKIAQNRRKLWSYHRPPILSKLRNHFSIEKHSPNLGLLQ